MGSEIDGAAEALTLNAVQKPPFALTLRLTPELHQDLLRAAAQKSDVTINFGSNTNSNVINVNGKQFNFTSFKEQYCDVYARQNQEEMWELGKVLRKCNVVRKLNDNEASRVRARRLESEANKKARVSHALDRDQSVKLSTNPSRVSSVKRVLKGKPAVPPKQTRAGPDSGSHGRLPSTASRSAPNISQSKPQPKSLGTAKSASDVSHEPAQPELITARPAPNPTSAQPKVVSEKKQPLPLASIPLATQAAAHAIEKGQSGLRAAAIVLLNERALTSKALERTLMDVTKERFPGNKKEGIDKLLKTIAIFKAPGRYFLTPEAEAEYKTIEADLKAKGSKVPAASEPVTPQPAPEPKAVLASDSVPAPQPAPQATKSNGRAQSNSGVSQDKPEPTATRPEPRPHQEESQASDSSAAAATGGSGKQRELQRIQKGGTKRSRAALEAEDGSDDEFFAPYEHRPPERIERIATLEQYDRYCAMYQQKYPVYRRMHAELSKNGREFLDLEDRYKAGDRHEKSTAEGEMRQLLRQRSRRIARMDRIFGAMHEELKAIKQEVCAFQQAHA